jgi:hypothetical protein
MTFKMSEVVLVSFVAVHATMEVASGATAAAGIPGPVWLFVGLMLLAYLTYMRLDRQPWYKLVLVFLPIIGGILLDEMFDTFSDDLVERSPWFAFFVPWVIGLTWFGICTYLWPQVLQV